MKRLDQLTQLTAAQLAQDDIIGIRDQSAGQTKYITVKDLTGSPDFGWSATGESWSFSSWSSTTSIGVVTVPTDATTKYAVNNLVRFSQTTGGTKYGRILSLTATTLTIWMPGYTLNNEALTSPVYSVQSSPVGAPIGLVQAVPYKFSTYLAANQTGAADFAFTKVLFNTENYDTNNNFDTTLGRFTAPVTGYYQINLYLNSVTSSSTGVGYELTALLYKNGSALRRSDTYPTAAGSSIILTGNLSPVVFLTAGDYLEAYIWADVSSGNTTVVGGTTNSYFDGYLQSRL